MKPFKLDRWVRQIAETQPEEISCSDCLDRISEYVDAEQAGVPLAPHLHEVAQHLFQCQVCREEYEVLSDLVELENKGEAPSVDELKNSIK